MALSSGFASRIVAVVVLRCRRASRSSCFVTAELVCDVPVSLPIAGSTWPLRQDVADLV